jgi:murein DD-endopeptidase MepM/ murein hydrolase activator NlpD
MRTSLPLFLLSAGSLLILCGCGASSAGNPPPIVVEPVPAFLPPVHTQVLPGDTIETVCRRLAGNDWVQWRDTLTIELDPRRLQPGTAFDGICSRAGKLLGLRVTLDIRSELLLEKVDGDIYIEKIQRPIETATVRYTGTVSSSLFAAIAEAGGEPELAVRVAEVFQWDIDFLRDLRQGDAFAVVADRLTVDGSYYGYGTIYVARFINRGRVLNAVAYVDGDGRLGYYDEQGRPLRKQFLRAPLKLSRITSRFSMRRVHPIHKRTMPHYGVDYAAPTGTPVLATADGTVSSAGRSSGAGKIVRIRHANGFETSYLHLSRYGRGVRKGARVRQGQVIGYVGSTGWSTGPHLDYRVKQNGRWINPLALSSPPVKPLDESRLAAYNTHAEEALALLDGDQAPSGQILRARLDQLTQPASSAGAG